MMELPFPDVQTEGPEELVTDTPEHRETVARFIRETFGDPLPRRRAKYERQEEMRLYYARVWKEIEGPPEDDGLQRLYEPVQPSKIRTGKMHTSSIQVISLPSPKPEPKPKEVEIKQVGIVI